MSEDFKPYKPGSDTPPSLPKEEIHQAVARWSTQGSFVLLVEGKVEQVRSFALRPEDNPTPELRAMARLLSATLEQRAAIMLGIAAITGDDALGTDVLKLIQEKSLADLPGGYRSDWASFLGTDDET